MQNKRHRGNLRLSNLKKDTTIQIPDGLTFYCKSCHQILDIKPKNFVFKSPIDGCRKADAPNLNKDKTQKSDSDCEIVYGTERSIKRYFKIPDEKFDKERREREDKAQRADKL